MMGTMRVTGTMRVMREVSSYELPTFTQLILPLAVFVKSIDARKREGGSWKRGSYIAFLFEISYECVHKRLELERARISIPLCLVLPSCF